MDEFWGVYEKCRVLIKALFCADLDQNDKDALAWLLQESFKKLGELIE